jgi:uncharacterized protein YcfJ
MEVGMKQRMLAVFSVLLLTVVFACSDPMTTREKTAGVGAVVGSNVGAGIGSYFGYACTGGFAGAVLGLGVGAVVGGAIEAQEKKRDDLNQRIEQCDLDIQRQSEKLDELKKEVQGR